MTSGTGSGKTESFLLPIIAKLLEERPSSQNRPPIGPWWENEFTRHDKRWKPLRPEVPGTAMRALILYPTNALVEDQIARLRLSAMIAKKETENPLFYFGRYTGATLGRTFVPPLELRQKDRDNINEAIREIQKITEEAENLKNVMKQNGHSEEQILDAASQFQDPYCGELLTRWDMIATPPDILITNTSMLNLMLLRENEAPIFDKTRDWLESNPDNQFHLIVDELHSYRGTQGTEVALVVRNFLDRLGISSSSQQLRCLATSASLDAETGHEYLEQFFGVNRETFAIFPGEPREVNQQLPIEKKKNNRRGIK